MTATVAVTRPVPGETYDPVTGTTIPTLPESVWSGAARIQAVPAPSRGQIVAGQLAAPRSYYVGLPLPDSQIVRVGDLVDVTSCEDDALTGRALLVADVSGASLVWQRDLICTIDLTTEPETGS
jgi:hypothetical protein